MPFPHLYYLPLVSPFVARPGGKARAGSAAPGSLKCGAATLCGHASAGVATLRPAAAAAAGKQATAALRRAAVVAVTAAGARSGGESDCEPPDL